VNALKMRDYTEWRVWHFAADASHIGWLLSSEVIARYLLHDMMCVFRTQLCAT